MSSPLTSILLSGDVESTEPTKSLMRIAEYIDSHEEKEELRAWFADNKEEVLDMLAAAGGQKRSNGDSKETRCVSTCARDVVYHLRSVVLYNVIHTVAIL